MDFLSFFTLPETTGFFGIFWWMFTHGGWLLLLWVVVYILYLMYTWEINHQFIHSIEWVFLSIKVPRENLTSTLAVESVFAQMHAVHTSLTFQDIHIEGKTQLWYSLELISMGGKISFIIRAPKSTKDLVEASVYAQYPTAEITEMPDYMQNIDYNPDTSDFDLWGTEWKLVDDDVIPIKTYKDFEHPTAEEKIIDPLAAHFEALNKMGPHEFYGVQIIIQPLGDNEWVPRGQAKIQELIGAPPEHKTTLGSLLMAPFNAVADFSFMDLIAGGGHGSEGKNDAPNKLLFLTDVEKERVNFVGRKIGKPGYRTKIRHLYIAPKDKYDGSKKSIVIGSYRPLGSAMTNSFKPDTKRTWTGVKWKVSPTLEKPYMDMIERKRKVIFFNGYKNRDIHVGNAMFIMNIEELATIYHFPISSTIMAADVEKTESKKSMPPANLPVVE